DQGLAEIARRKSNLIDLYQYGRFKLADLDQKMEEVETTETSLERRRTECLGTIEAYRRRRFEPDKLYQALAQIEEIFRFSRKEHRREIVRTLCRQITVKKGGELECSVAFPQEPEIARLSASAAPGGEVVYPETLQWNPVRGERHSSRCGHGAAADEPGIRNRVVRGTKRPCRDDGLTVQNAHHAVDL